MSTDVVEQLTRSRTTLAWVRAGFSRAEAATWADAGWSDPDAAARWRSTAPLADPHSLHDLSSSGYSPDQVIHSARFAPTYATAWTRACGGPAAAEDADDAECAEGADRGGDAGARPQRRASDSDPLEALFDQSPDSTLAT